MNRKISVLSIVFCLPVIAMAQENSPYSRYGLGDAAPNQNILSRGMGGISAGVSNSKFSATNRNQFEIQSLNITNPAALSSVTSTIFDVAAEADFRTLKSSSPAQKFTSANSYFSYLQLSFPVTTKNMRKKGTMWGFSFGLKPVTKINYKIEKNQRLAGIDSLNTTYEGTGGVNQAYFGTALRIKNLSMGLQAGYMFGSKDYSTKLTFLNDTIAYRFSNSANNTNFGGLFVNAGLQYEIQLNKDNKQQVAKILRLGVYGNLKQKLNATNDIIRETISYDGNGGFYRLDSVYEKKGVKGDIMYPANIGFGFVYQDEHWLYGADYEFNNWGNYSYYGQGDDVKNSWTLRAGAQYFPARESTMASKYFNFVKYRAGIFYGTDYIKVNANRPQYGFSLGAGLPLTSLKRISYTGEKVMLNTALEVGNRGNKQTNLRENVVRFSVGLSMNANWFQRRKYF